MYYLNAKVVEINKNHVVGEVNGVGYLIYTTQNNVITIDQTHCFYTYEEKKLDRYNNVHSIIFGFLHKRQIDLFTFFLRIPGIGTKKALNILSNDIDVIFNILKNKDWTALSELKGMNQKFADLFYKELKKSVNSQLMSLDKHYSSETNPLNIDFRELNSALIAIGYKPSQIEQALDQIDLMNNSVCSVEEAVRRCVQIIATSNTISA